MCNCEAARAEAEAAALRAELETAETLRASANAEIARLAAQVTEAKETIARVRAVAIDRVRAVVIEEVASELNRRYRINPATAMLGFYDWLRALAPLDPALCVVAVEARRAAIDAMLGALHHSPGTGAIRISAEKRAALRAALKALEEGR